MQHCFKHLTLQGVQRRGEGEMGWNSGKKPAFSGNSLLRAITMGLRAPQTFLPWSLPSSSTLSPRSLVAPVLTKPTEDVPRALPLGPQARPRSNPCGGPSHSEKYYDASPPHSPIGLVRMVLVEKPSQPETTIDATAGSHHP